MPNLCSFLLVALQAFPVSAA